MQLYETPFDDSLRVEGELTLKSNGKLIELGLPEPHEVFLKLMIPHLGLARTTEYVRIAKNSWSGKRIVNSAKIIKNLL